VNLQIYIAEKLKGNSDRTAVRMCFYQVLLLGACFLPRISGFDPRDGPHGDSCGQKVLGGGGGKTWPFPPVPS